MLSFSLFSLFIAIRLSISSLSIPSDSQYIRGYETLIPVAVVVDNLDVHAVAFLSDSRLNFDFTLYYSSHDISIGEIATTKTDANLEIDLAQLASAIDIGGSQEFTGQHDAILTRADCPLVHFLCAVLTPSEGNNPSYSLFPGLDHIHCIDLSTTHISCEGEYCTRVN